MAGELEGKIALVTGASRGLGREIARRLGAEGARVAAAGRDRAALAETVAALGGESEAQAFEVDLAAPDGPDQLVARVTGALGPIDVLVNNAAEQGPLGPIESVDWAGWRRVFDVGLFAPARLCRLVIPAMRERGGGKIVNLSGGGATGPRPDVSAYACCKTALARLTETLAEELKDARIDVNGVSPGAMNTRMLDETIAAGPGGARREYAAAIERARTGGADPGRAADLVAFLASSASSGITGRLISAVWDDWAALARDPDRRRRLGAGDVYTLRRIVPKDRGLDW